MEEGAVAHAVADGDQLGGCGDEEQNDPWRRGATRRTRSTMVAPGAVAMRAAMTAESVVDESGKASSAAVVTEVERIDDVAVVAEGHGADIGVAQDGLDVGGGCWIRRVE